MTCWWASLLASSFLTFSSFASSFTIYFLDFQFAVVKYALPHFVRGSTIINSSSVTAYKGSQAMIDYSTTKGAINSFTRSMAYQLAPRGIRVNAVAVSSPFHSFLQTVTLWLYFIFSFALAAWTSLHSNATGFKRRRRNERLGYWSTTFARQTSTGEHSPGFRDRKSVV